MTKNNLQILKEIDDLRGSHIARYLSISPCTYSQWENDKIPIPTRRILDLSNFFKINADYLLVLTPIKLSIDNDTSLNLPEIGARLKELRYDLGLSLRELGQELNYSYSSLSSYERGQHLIQSEILISLCRRTNCSVDWVLGRRTQKYLYEYAYEIIKEEE